MQPMSSPARSIEIISDPDRAVVLLKSPRRRILELARTPTTAVEIADRLGETRQRIGYHVRQLADVGLLAERPGARRGAMVEKRYLASASAYALSPGLLGPLAARLEDAGDRESLVHLLGALHQAQTDLGRLLDAPGGAPSRLPTLTLSTRIRLSDAARRGAFADALVRALAEVVGAYAAPFDQPGGGGPAPGVEPFRLTLTLHPTPS